eukprot:CAMPEP_0117550010 /NCGR_PEP_ID=MMETSP0784-20121206/48460_1 /TAXON_ID=39447 /ORGANISM="" /LENGTH=293 /DNA_ID=CAMNT_0005347015 /DNA_START=288 /DNA_END=1169 /DNA_ORIENTATION=+
MAMFAGGAAATLGAAGRRRRNAQRHCKTQWRRFWHGLRGALARIVRELCGRPVIVWPPEEDACVAPWGAMDTFGWTWDQRFTDDENLLNLAYAASLNAPRFGRGMPGGCFGAVLCHPPQHSGSLPFGRRRVEVLGLGAHYLLQLAGPESENGDSRAYGKTDNSETRAGATEGIEGNGGGEASSRSLTGARANTLHAEVGLVARCARDGVSTEGSWLFVVKPPCWDCVKALLMAGVARIVFQEPDGRHFDRQREVVAATRASWVWTPRSPVRDAYLRVLDDASGLHQTGAAPGV